MKKSKWRCCKVFESDCYIKELRIKYIDVKAFIYPTNKEKEYHCNISLNHDQYTYYSYKNKSLKWVKKEMDWQLLYFIEKLYSEIEEIGNSNYKGKICIPKYEDYFHT